MQAVMTGLTAVPGVMGGMLSDERGNVLVHSFPPLFEAEMLRNATVLLQDNTIGLQEATGGVKAFDMRFELGRIIIRTLPRMFLMILCQPAVNVQLLYISLNVAVKKLEKLSSEHLLTQPAPDVPSPLLSIPSGRSMTASSAYADYRALTDAKGVLLTCEIMQKTAGTFWDSMSDQASVNRNTALEVSNYFKTGPFKKLNIVNRAAGLARSVPVTIIQYDREHLYDGKVLVTLALAEQLKVKEGEQVRAEVVVGGGLFGWEGI